MSPSIQICERGSRSFHVADESVLVIGAPSGARAGVSAQHPEFHAGVVHGVVLRNTVKFKTDLPGEDFSRPLLQSTKIVSSTGYSGGPWLDTEGKVIGITYSLYLAERTKFLQDDLDRIKVSRTTNGGIAKPIKIQ
jgi:S1-C subfamily serine protease